MEDIVLLESRLALYAILFISITFGFTLFLSLCWMLPKDNLDGDHDPNDYGVGTSVTTEDSVTKSATMLASFAMCTPVAFGSSALFNVAFLNDDFDGDVKAMLMLYAIIAMVTSIAFMCAALLTLCWMRPKADLSGYHDLSDYLAV